MSWLTTLGNLFVPEPTQNRSMEFPVTGEFPAFADQLAAIRRSQSLARPWRLAGVNEALGVPSILSAVSLISGTVGSLSMEAFRRGVLLSDDQDIPRLIQRPNPRSTPRAFFRDTAYFLATRGEAWWWVAKRDVDDVALSVVPIPPWEITVERNDADRFNPTIRWLNKKMPNRDMRQITYLPSSDGLRGVGPLQLAGAAVSVTVESDAWAANFFAGNMPSMIGTTDQDLDANDLAELDKQWAEKPGNLPRWATSGMTFEFPPLDATKAQLTESRSFQVGETARMFSMPGPLLEYQMSGSSLTYRNEEDIWTDFQRRCLSPHYLEPIEQEMSDLLTRSTVGRFNLEQLLRADVRSRFEAWKFGIDAGWLQPEEVRKKEGYEPGNVDFAPVAPSPPAADPGAVPYQVRTQADFRCEKCHRKLAESAGAGTVIRCRCGTVNAGPELFRTEAPAPPQINVHPAPVNVTIEAGAIAAPDLSGLAQAISDLVTRNEAPAAHFAEGAFQIAAPDMSGVAEALVAVADRPQPDISVHLPGPTVKRIERDEDGHLIRIVEEAG